MHSVLFLVLYWSHFGLALFMLCSCFILALFLLWSDLLGGVKTLKVAATCLIYGCAYKIVNQVIAEIFYFQEINGKALPGDKQSPA